MLKFSSVMQAGVTDRGAEPRLALSGGTRRRATRLINRTLRFSCPRSTGPLTGALHTLREVLRRPDVRTPQRELC